MAIPDFQSVMRPVLAAVQDGVPLALNELRERVADQFQLTDDERKERLPSGHQTVINNRVGWARTYLNKAGLLATLAKAWLLLSLGRVSVRGFSSISSSRMRVVQVELPCCLQVESNQQATLQLFVLLAFCAQGWGR